MTKLYPISFLMYADFLERIRRYSFFITISLAAILVYWFLPPTSASYVTVGLGNYRGVYNSAWIGTVRALILLTRWLLYPINWSLKAQRTYNKIALEYSPSHKCRHS